MKIVDIADEVFRELGEPSDVSIPAIAYWLRANVGKLNSAINTAYFVDDVTFEVNYLDEDELPVEIGEDEKCIFKLLYIVHYYDTQIRKNILSYTVSSAIEVTSDGHSVRMVSPTEIGKNLYVFRKGLSEELKTWINWYRLARSGPRQVTGDDTIEGPDSRPAYRTTYNYYE